MKEPEYTEGTQALKNFRQLATMILQAPDRKKKKQTKKSASQKGAEEIRQLQAAEQDLPPIESRNEMG